MWVCGYVGHVWYLELSREPRHVAQQLSYQSVGSAEGTKLESNNRRKSNLCHVGIWVAVFISRIKARSATNEVPKCRSQYRALLMTIIIFQLKSRGLFCACAVGIII